MLHGAKVLITGPTGNVAFPIARELAKTNDVYAMARFGNPGRREGLEALGITCIQKSFAADDLSGIPDDFTHVLHLAVFQEMAWLMNSVVAVSVPVDSLSSKNAPASRVRPAGIVYEPGPALSATQLTCQSPRSTEAPVPLNSSMVSMPAFLISETTTPPTVLHTPDEQVSLAAHGAPQVPHCAGFSERLMHAPSHSDNPG